MLKAVEYNAMPVQLHEGYIPKKDKINYSLHYLKKNCFNVMPKTFIIQTF